MGSKLRVLIFITKLELGGAQKKQIYFTRNLPTDAFDVRLLAGAGGMLDREAKDTLGDRLILWTCVRREISPVRDVYSILKLTRFLKDESIDVLYTHSSKAGVIGRIAARLAGVKVVHHYHGFAFHDRQHPLIRAFYIAIERFAARFADLHLADALENIRKALANGIGRPDRFQVLRCGIDTQDLMRTPPAPDKIRREFRIPPNAPVVGTVGNFKSQKSPMDLARVADIVISKNPDTHFFLVGDGPGRSVLEAFISEKPYRKQIILAGWRRDLSSVYTLLDVFYLMSLWEGLPTVVSEAKWFGVPVIATDVDGTTESIRDGVTGFLIPPGDVALAAQQILSLLENRDLRKSVAAAARAEAFPEFDLQTAVPQLALILKKV